MATQPSRPVAKRSDLDLTPPEEIRARRIRQRIFLGTLGVCALGVGLYFAAPSIGRAIKDWQSHRLAREAFALIDQRKWTEAVSKARDAYFLSPSEPQSWRAIARVASRTGQWAAALDWWKKVDEAHRLTLEDRRDFAGAALNVGDTPIAAQQVEILLAQHTGTEPHDILLAGQVAARQSDPVLALDYAERALADKGTKPYDILSAATLVLSVTSPYSPPYASAWQQIEAVARDPKNPASLDALALLAQEKAQRPMTPLSGNAFLSLETGSTPPGSMDSPSQPTSATQLAEKFSLELRAPPPPTSDTATMSLTEVANALENHPDARPYHKLLAIEVRARQDPILTDQYVADAVERFGNAARLAEIHEGNAQRADETLAALVTWLNKIGRPAKTLEVLPQARALQRQDFFLQYINALAALQRWSDMKELLTSERPPIDPMMQHMYLAIAQTRLGSTTGASNEWQRALEVANSAEKLMALANYAEQNSIDDVANAAYSEAIKIAPKNREAYSGRLRIALAEGHTAQAQTIAAEIAQLWPDDAAVRNQDAYLQLLLGASDGVAEAAERDADVLVRMEPRNWLARATLGLARLRLGRKKEALAAIRDLRVTGVEPSGPLAVRAAILAANGYEEGARNDARILGAKPLLPEERALIAPIFR